MVNDNKQNENENENENDEFSIARGESEYDMSAFEKMPENRGIQKTSDDVTKISGKSDVGLRRNLGSNNNKLLMYALAILALCACAYGYYAIKNMDLESGERADKPIENKTNPTKDFKRDFEEQAVNAQVESAGSEPANVDYNDTTDPVIVPVTTIENEPTVVQPVTTQETNQFQPQKPEPTKAELRMERILGGGFGGGKALGGGGSASPVTYKEDGESKESGLSAKMNNYATFAGAKAGRMTNRDMSIDKGSFIDCVLTTRFNSQLAGMLSCQTTRNVYSSNGKVVLIDRGSTVTGQYQGDVETGQARVFVVWDRVVTPKGVSIDIGSPSASTLGESGLTGRINTHFWKNLGNAFMVSLVGSTADATGESIGKSIGKKLDKALGNPVGTSEVNFSENSGSSSPSDIAVKSLEQIGKTVPTITKNQGDRITIYVSRDLDFSKVYKINQL